MATITFDGPNKIIDIGYDAATTTVTVPDIYSRWKDWVKAGNAQYYEAFDLSVGGNDLGSGLSLDGYIFLRNDLGWRIRPADQDHTLIISGQMFGYASGTAVYLDRPGRTVNIREIQSSRSQIVNPSASTVNASQAFQGRVWLKPSSMHSGTDFPNGTSVQPVNNLDDAISICNVYGIEEIYILENVTVNHNVSGLILAGANNGVYVNVLAGANVLYTTFDGLNVNGYFDGEARIRNGQITEVLEGFQGFIQDCQIYSGTHLSGNTIVQDCQSGQPYQGGAFFDFDSNVCSLQVREWSGTIEIRNMVAGCSVSVDISAGRLIIADTCTGGNLKVRGVGEPVEDYSGGAVILDKDGFISLRNIADWVWDEPYTEHATPSSFGGLVRLMGLIQTNKIITDPVAGTYTVYDTDGTTVLFVANLFEDAGGLQTYRGQGAERREAFGTP